MGEYLARGHYSRQFIDHYLVPMGAAIWSARSDRFLRFPARFLIRFFDNHCGAYWGYGFHEDGVKSALAVGECFGRRLESC